MIIYFEIFGAKLKKELPDEKYASMTDAQIEYFVRGKLKINKIEKEKYDFPDELNKFFGGFNKKGK